MRTKLTLTLCWLACAGLAAAQTKITGTGKCEKPDPQQMVEVGDRTGHSLMLAKQACTWTAPLEMAGLKSKTYTGSVTSDVSGQKGRDSGYVVVIMDNGDKAFVRFTGATTMKDGGGSTGEGTWSYTGGTGKLRGLKGKGTYKSTSAADGTAEDQVEGDYSLPEPGAASKAKKP